MAASPRRSRESRLLRPERWLWVAVWAVLTWSAGSSPASAADPQIRPARVAVLWTTSRELAQPLLDALSIGLRELGWDNGRNLVLDNRFTDGKAEALQGLAADVVASKPDLVVAPLNAAALAVRRHSSELPIVFVLGIDPVAVGLASSLSRPSLNATGMAVAGPETAAKRLQILRELAPQSRRIGMIGNAADPSYRDIRARVDTAAARLGVTIVDGTVHGAIDLRPALAKLVAERIDSLLVLGDNLTHLHLKDIVTTAAAQRWAAIYSQPQFCDGGGLACYGINLQASFRHSARIVDKILRGDRASEIPIEMPTIWEFTLNVRAANAIGVALPPALRLRADRLIE